MSVNQLQRTLGDIDFTDEPKVEGLGPGRRISTLSLPEDEILLIEVLDHRPLHLTAAKRSITYEDVYERQKRAKLVATAPSSIAKASEYKSMQKKLEEKILDDRPSLDLGIPPIALLYDGFGHFLDICRGSKDTPDLDAVERGRLKRKVNEFAQEMCRDYENEDMRRDRALEFIHDILQCHKGTSIPRPTAASIRSYRSDGHIIGEHGAAGFILEVKDEVTGCNAIPVVEVAAYFAHTLTAIIDSDSKRRTFQGWRVPCLGLTIVGPDVTFHAIIALDHQYRVVPLTSTLSCLPNANDGDDREMLCSAFTAASVLLHRILKDGDTYVKSPPPQIPVPLRRNPAISELRRYSSSGCVKFQIQESYDKQPCRWLYIAKTDDNEKILVKFTRQYSIELHQFCADLGRAPKILGFEKLPGGWYAVAMEYLSSAFPLLQAKGDVQLWITKLQTLVKSFHDKGFVHGDLRDPNIICDDKQVFLIDFDWAGRTGQASYPLDLEDLNPDLLKDRLSTDPRITEDDDNRVLSLTVGKVRDKFPSVK